MERNEVRDKRGISPEVWDKRPYTRWDGENYAEVMDAAYDGLTGYQKGYMKRLAKQRGGWIINRHATPHAPKIYPEIRPDGPVETNPATMHWHGTGDPEAVELPDKKDGEPGLWSPEGGWRVMERGSVAWREHCNKVNRDLGVDGAHEQVEEPHTHENKAKYVFPPGKWVDGWREPHDHASKYYQKTPDALAAHIEVYHDGHPGPYGEHCHQERVKEDESLAKRLDVHPMAADRWNAAERIYFGIEGCLKADAILSAIIKEGRAESVFSVPSVSLWAADEFPEFLSFLRGKQVVIIPDADWFEKPQVLRHARMAQRYLQRRGIETYVAAPPQSSGHKGVDDYLGDGGSLDKLEVLEREASELIPKVLEFRSGAVRLDAWENMRGLIYDLAFFANPPDPQRDDPKSAEGYVYAGMRTTAKILDIGKSTVADNLKRMQDFEWITIERLYKGKWIDDRKVKVSKWTHDSDGHVYKIGLEFEHRTRLRVHEMLRGTDLPPFFLGDLGKAKRNPDLGRNHEDGEEHGDTGEASEVEQASYARAARGAR